MHKIRFPEYSIAYILNHTHTPGTGEFQKATFIDSPDLKTE